MTTAHLRVFNLLPSNDTKTEHRFPFSRASTRFSFFSVQELPTPAIPWDKAFAETFGFVVEQIERRGTRFRELEAEYRKEMEFTDPKD